MRIGFAAAVLAGSLVSVTASAQAPARVLVLVEEQHDGARAAAGGGENKLSQALLGAGYSLVERYDAEQARSKISLDRMLHGDTSGLEVTGLHADVLVVARISVEKEEAPYGISYPVNRARIELKALLVDSGRIFHTDSASAGAMGDAGTAAAKVAQQVTPALLEAMKKGLGNREVLEVRVAGLKDAKAADALAARLSQVPGVKWAKPRYVSADATMIDVAAPGMEPQKLEAALAAAHLVVARRSANVIEARYDETEVARRTVAVAAFANKSGRPDLDWVGPLLADVFETELVNSKYLSPSATAGRPHIDPDKVQTHGVTADVLVVGRVDKVGPKLRLVAKAINIGSGALLATAEQFDDEAKLADLAKEVVWKLDEQLYKKLVGKSSLEGYISPPTRKTAMSEVGHTTETARGGGPRVHVDEVTLGNLFPARIGWYAENPLGKVALRNDGATDASDVRLEISLGDLSGGAQTIRVGAIPAGKRVEVPLKLVLERKQLLEVSQRRPARADLALVIGADRQPFTEPLVLWDRNAIDWNVGESVAAFVTPKDPVVRAFADQALKLEGELPGSLPGSVRTAAAVFDAILSLGVRYQKDPTSPYGAQAIDTVQFPRETLTRRAGDCDDLATLYAAVMQAAGEDVRLVLTPGHIFVAVNSGLPFSHAGERLGAGRAFELDGSAFIPVEITRIDGGFAAAWQAGLEEIGRYAGKTDYVNVASAWRNYPAFPMDAPGQAPSPDVSRARRILAADGTALAPRSAALASATAPAAPEERLAWAIGQGERGDRKQAIEILRALSNDGPKELRARAANDLGNVETLDHRYTDATRDYEHALAGGIDKSTVEHNLGVAFYNAGNGAEAKKHFERSGSADDRALLRKLGLASRDPAPPKKTTMTPKATGSNPSKTPTTTQTHDESASEEGMRAGRELDPRDALIWLGKK
jgi:hypothetical protein